MGLLTRVADAAPSSLSRAAVEKAKNHQQHHQHAANVGHGDFDVEQVPVAGQHAQVKANEPRSILKAKLKSLLAKYNGCTKNKAVVDVVDQLAEMNPTTKNCAQSNLFQGEFYTLTAPTFPGRLKPLTKDQEDIVQYTLGRISFNIFQPNKLVCTLRSVRNPVRPRTVQTKDGQTTFSYHLMLDITIHTPDGGDLPATMINEAYCYEHPDVNNRLMVTFTGGTLMPADEIVHDPTKLKLWETTFQGAYQKADEERSYFGWFFHYFLKLLLGLTLPSDHRSQQDILKNSFHFDMKRSPTGHMDVLYLDEDLRITKGNRGTIVIAERAVTLPLQ
jgi:PAP_fibrillin